VTLAQRLPRTHCPPGVAPSAVVRIEESTDPKRRARVLAESRLRLGSGRLQADLFKIAWRRLRAARAAGDSAHSSDSDPPTVPAPEPAAAGHALAEVA
jgi:hypothetical protein